MKRECPKHPGEFYSGEYPCPVCVPSEPLGASDCSPDLVESLRRILPAYLDTLSEKEDYWDGLYTSDRAQAETDIAGFIEYIEANRSVGDG